MAKIVSKINSFLGNDEAVLKKREQFGFLQKMAQAKCAEFKSELEKMYMGDRSITEISGNRAMRYYMSQHVDIKSGCNEAINTAVGEFFKGKDGLKGGFQNLVTAALESLINTTAIGEAQEEMYFVYPENLAVVRVDVKCYKYSFSNKGFITDCENIFCYTMAKSVVDHTKLTLDELVYMMSEMSGSQDIKTVKAFVTELTDLWDMLAEPRDSRKQFQIEAAKETTELKRGVNDKKTITSSINNINELKEAIEPLGWSLEKTIVEDDGNIIIQNEITKQTDEMNYALPISGDLNSIAEAVDLVNIIEAPFAG